MLDNLGAPPLPLSFLLTHMLGDVFLSSNDMLCYLPNFSLLLDGSPGQIFDPDTLSAYRRPATECGRYPNAEHTRVNMCMYQPCTILVCKMMCDCVSPPTCTS